MYSEFGKRIKFKIVEDLGNRFILDTDFRIARIQLDSGETSLASFDRDHFLALNDREATIEAAMGHQVFSSDLTGPHSFGEPDPEAVLMLTPDPKYMVGRHEGAERFWRGIALPELQPDRPPVKKNRAMSFFSRMLGGKRDTGTFGEDDFAAIISFWQQLGYAGIERKNESVFVPVAFGEGTVEITQSQVTFHDAAINDPEAIKAGLAHAKKYWNGRMNIYGDNEEFKLKSWAHAQVEGVEVMNWHPPAYLRDKAQTMVFELQGDLRGDARFATIEEVHYALGGPARPGYRVPTPRGMPQDVR